VKTGFSAAARAVFLLWPLMYQALRCGGRLEARPSFDARRNKGEIPQADIRGIEDGVSDGSGSDGNCSVSCACRAVLKSENFGNGVGLLHLSAGRQLHARSRPGRTEILPQGLPVGSAGRRILGIQRRGGGQEITRAWCWSHATRKIIEAEKAAPEITRDAIEMVRALYAVVLRAIICRRSFRAICRKS
jgi:hypothetical protein